MSHAAVAAADHKKRPPVDALIAGLSSSKPKVKFGSAKKLWLLSERKPEELYPKFDFFLGLLDHENHILRWNAARILACLAPADRAGRLDAALEKYLSPIRGPEMIAAATAIQFGARIATAKPHLADRIARAILEVADARYKTDECRNVAIGHAITSLGHFFTLITDQDAVLAFVNAQRGNSRAATRKKAEAFLKKHSAPASRLT